VRPLVLAIGLFFVFLLARKTLVMQAQGPVPVALEQRSADPGLRGRRLASLEAQDQILALRQQALEAELEQSSETSRRMRDRIERVSLVPDDDSSPAGYEPGIAAEQQRLQRNVRETRAELERVVSERRRVQDEWAGLTGIRPSR
jgi:hypothetical protein